MERGGKTNGNVQSTTYCGKTKIKEGERRERRREDKKCGLGRLKKKRGWEDKKEMRKQKERKRYGNTKERKGSRIQQEIIEERMGKEVGVQKESNRRI